MEKTIDELLGSLSGAVVVDGGSKFSKTVRKFYRRMVRKHRNLLIQNQPGACINLFVVMDNHVDIHVESPGNYIANQITTR